VKAKRKKYNANKEIMKKKREGCINSNRSKDQLMIDSN
jgi:hypothetical protein